MKRCVAAIFFLFCLAMTAARAGNHQSGETTQAPPVNPYCANPNSPPNQFCPDIPTEVNDKLIPGYSGLFPNIQRAFDDFSWQSLIALNWPADARGKPLDGPFGSKPDAPRVWEFYTDPTDVFDRSLNEAILKAGRLTPGTKVLRLMAKNSQVLNPDGSFAEPDGNPLIDRNLNFVLYEIKMNPDEVNYVTTNGLQTKQGQQGKTVSFPGGPTSYGPVGAIEIKASWRILQKGDDLKRFYHRPAVIYVAAENSATGKPMYLRATVGLTGFHIIHKTKQFPAWIWTTFEQVDNSPVSGRPAGTKRYSFFNPECPSCPTNVPPKLGPGQKNFIWAAKPPYAAQYAVNGKFGTQVVRNPIDPQSGTEAVNAVWRARLKGTVWEHYELIGSQWVGGDPGPVSIPKLLGNSTIETYIQSTSSCVDCHRAATTAVNTNADFSFLLGLAK